jgi:prophage regulatory protein
MHQHDCDRLIDGREADDICGTSRTKRYELMARGEFPVPVKLGKSVRYSMRECHEWVAARIAARDTKAGA